MAPKGDPGEKGAKGDPGPMGLPDARTYFLSRLHAACTQTHAHMCSLKRALKRNADTGRTKADRTQTGPPERSRKKKLSCVLWFFCKKICKIY
ncbi:PREDICTED: uncharacterized protein LOC108781902 isoform X1 [Cyphomyrmex costatus]|uniref:uncharacterized protein LOC108781902 isoform X1 n=1 Tax=Cyphomyrmex costatus TaxID=456900 RepID=UPI0008523F69|nr:PREDICTED: uncharacterized protein LOC108781902 isoform X1 [Cyphomyrmex costatus]